MKRTVISVSFPQVISVTTQVTKTTVEFNSLRFSWSLFF